MKPHKLFLLMKNKRIVLFFSVLIIIIKLNLQCYFINERLLLISLPKKAQLMSYSKCWGNALLKVCFHVRRLLFKNACDILHLYLCYFIIGVLCLWAKIFFSNWDFFKSSMVFHNHTVFFSISCIISTNKRFKSGIELDDLSFLGNSWILRERLSVPRLHPDILHPGNTIPSWKLGQFSLVDYE